MGEIEGFKSGCFVCSGTGWVRAVEIKSSHSYAFKCGMCKAADFSRLSQLIPIWSSGFKNRFERYDEWLMSRKWEGNKDESSNYQGNS